VQTRYLDWIGSFVRGDLGKSIVTGRPVSNDVFIRLGRSLTLASIAALFGVTGGILMGVFLAQRKGTPTDFRCVTILLVLASMPEFLIGIALYLVFVVWLDGSPLKPAWHSRSAMFGRRAVTFVLPAATIALLLHAAHRPGGTCRDIRGLAASYVGAARLRGLNERQVKWDHAFRMPRCPWSVSSVSI